MVNPPASHGTDDRARSASRSGTAASCAVSARCKSMAAPESSARRTATIAARGVGGTENVAGALPLVAMATIAAEQRSRTISATRTSAARGSFLAHAQHLHHIVFHGTRPRDGCRRREGQAGRIGVREAAEATRHEDVAQAFGVRAAAERVLDEGVPSRRRAARRGPGQVLEAAGRRARTGTSGHEARLRHAAAGFRGSWTDRARLASGGARRSQACRPRRRRRSQASAGVQARRPLSRARRARGGRADQSCAPSPSRRVAMPRGRPTARARRAAAAWARIAVWDRRPADGREKSKRSSNARASPYSPSHQRPLAARPSARRPRPGSPDALAAATPLRNASPHGRRRASPVRPCRAGWRPPRCPGDRRFARNTSRPPRSARGRHGPGHARRAGVERRHNTPAPP